MTSLNNSSQSTYPTDECFGKNYSSFLDFIRNYERMSGIFVPCGLVGGRVFYWNHLVGHLVRRLHRFSYFLLVNTVKFWLSEGRISQTTGFVEGDGWFRHFSLLSIAVKLPIFRISIFRKIQFFEELRLSQ